MWDRVYTYVWWEGRMCPAIVISMLVGLFLVYGSAVCACSIARNVFKSIVEHEISNTIAASGDFSKHESVSRIQILFGNQLELTLDLDESVKTLKDLILYLKDHHLKEREELFVSEDSVRPGILVLVNDTDWDILGKTEYELEENDAVVFISTLHGG